jgi:hypothetical protein
MKLRWVYSELPIGSLLDTASQCGVISVLGIWSSGYIYSQGGETRGRPAGGTAQHGEDKQTACLTMYPDKQIIVEMLSNDSKLTVIKQNHAGWCQAVWAEIAKSIQSSRMKSHMIRQSKCNSQPLRMPWPVFR